MARLVNKQFNSPIGLYSEQNIREVIQRESQILSNGAVGINFNNPNVGKPSNLQNSAVLRMLEEEEQRQRSGQAPSNGYTRPLRDQIKWPPPEFEHKNLQRSSFKDVVTPGTECARRHPLYTLSCLGMSDFVTDFCCFVEIALY
jgi:hypothetical protein